MHTFVTGPDRRHPLCDPLSGRGAMLRQDRLAALPGRIRLTGPDFSDRFPSICSPRRVPWRGFFAKRSTVLPTVSRQTMARGIHRRRLRPDARGWLPCGTADGSFLRTIERRVFGICHVCYFGLNRFYLLGSVDPASCGA